MKADRPVRYIVDAKPIPQVRQVIDLLGIDIRDASLVVPNPTADYRVRNLRVTSLNSMKPAISLSTFSEFRRRALLAIKQSRAVPVGIYVGRKAVTKRLILNQPEIETYLSNLGISSFYPEEHSFIEAAEVFHSCQVVVIVIGSSKFNLALCQPGTKVICLVPEGYAEKPGSVALMVRQLCALFKLNLCFCSCRIQGGMGLDSDLIVEKSFLQEALRTLAVG